MMQHVKIYDEVAAFLAQAAPVQILEYHPSEATQQRYDMLVFKKKETELSTEEASELEYYFMLEHIFRLAKIRAAAHLTA
jgi:hypothetical protein